MGRVDPDLSFLLNKASETLTARMTRALGEYGLSVRQYCVLDKAAAGDRTQGQIAEEALLDKTTMVVTLDGLEKAGLAERTACPRDRRVRLIRTTADGDRLLEKATDAIRGLYDDVLGALPAEARDALVDGLTRLVGPDGPLHDADAEARPRRSSRTG
jgi:DNA-binding MarR family transcriptional regulator